MWMADESTEQIASSPVYSISESSHVGTMKPSKTKKISPLSKEAHRRRKLIDELGDIEAQFASLEEARGARRKEIALEIIGWSASSPPQQADEYEGYQYAALVSAMGNVRTVDKRAAFAVLGQGAYLEASSITIKAVEEAKLAPEKFAKIVSAPLRAGPRSVKTHRRQAVAQIAKAA
jgi:hypothetical protein